MLLTRFYYTAKPWLPSRLRFGLRRALARRQRARSAEIWPILESAARPPEGWPGWPDGRRFALVLTHDVESQRGVENVRPLAELEMAHGIRSAFYFVPEGSYRVPPELRNWLTDHGFEVGVHDLHHDGKLYRSRAHFERCARRINRYLEAWNASGFRSGFMLHRLDWLHALQVEYDASTFDTDPFEPQPDGVGTIFPFWVPAADAPGRRALNGRAPGSVPGPGAPGPLTSDLRSLPSNHAVPPLRRGGYFELPYTLPQDSTLFLLFQEPTPELWLRKLDWVAAHGGLAMLTVHPDYVALGKHAVPGTFPVEHYRALLRHICARYRGDGWITQPAEIVSHLRAARGRPDTAAEVAERPTGEPPSAGTSVSGPAIAAARGSAGPIWVDLDNTPHVPFFVPIIGELEKRGHRVVVTARDAFQVCELADLKGLAYERIGRHHGRNKLLKLLGLFYRAAQLVPFALRTRPCLAVSHGARSQVIACNLLRIPTVVLADYEFAATPPLMRPRWEIVPEAIPAESVSCPPGRVRKYPGIKEDVYAWTLKPDDRLLPELGIHNGEIVVVVRPPANEAHYHNPESEVLFEAVMERLHRRADTRIVLLPRNRKQGQQILTRWPHWFASGRIALPDKAVDGLNLLWHADLVISGGGTMNREAAALGVPVYSIFRGRTGAVDAYLEAEHRLILLRSVEDIDRVVTVCRRPRSHQVTPAAHRALPRILDHLEEVVRESTSPW